MERAELVDTHIKLVWGFVRAALLKGVLHAALPATRLDFWRMMMGGSLDLAVIDWCKVFGSREEETHWTKLIPDADHAAFREGLHRAIGMTEQQWSKYHDQVKGYRDEFAAHQDIDPDTKNFPKLDTALEVAFYYYETYLYPEWAKHDRALPYPSDMRKYAEHYRVELAKAASLATEATKSLEGEGAA